MRLLDQTNIIVKGTNKKKIIKMVNFHDKAQLFQTLLLIKQYALIKIGILFNHIEICNIRQVEEKKKRHSF